MPHSPQIYYIYIFQFSKCQTNAVTYAYHSLSMYICRQNVPFAHSSTVCLSSSFVKCDMRNLWIYNNHTYVYATLQRRASKNVLCAFCRFCMDSLLFLLSYSRYIVFIWYISRIKNNYFMIITTPQRPCSRSSFRIRIHAFHTSDLSDFSFSHLRTAAAASNQTLATSANTHTMAKCMHSRLVVAHFSELNIHTMICDVRLNVLTTMHATCWNLNIHTHGHIPEQLFRILILI